MVDTLIGEFHAAEEELTALIDQYHSTRYNELDEIIAGTFESIRTFVPSNTKELKILIAFYLDLLGRTDQGGSRSIIACLRATLLEAIDRLVPDRVDPNA